MEKCIVIIPAYNEEKNIEQVINGVKECLPQADIVVVNDGSTDTTEKIAKKIKTIVLSLPCNMGYGIALQTGYKYAKRKNYKYILQLDGDGQHDPFYLKDILETLITEKVNVVIGSRFLKKESYKPPFFRKIGMKIFSFLTSLIIKQKITDPTSGFQGFNRDVLNFLTSEYFPVDYPDADVIIMFHRYGFKIKEVPVLMKKSPDKSMHSGLKPVYYIFKMFLSVFVTLLRKTKKKEGE